MAHKKHKMATKPKPAGYIVQENIGRAIAVSLQARRRLKELHQTAHDLNTAQDYMEMYGMWETIEGILKASQFGEETK